MGVRGERMILVKRICESSLRSAVIITQLRASMYKKYSKYVKSIKVLSKTKAYSNCIFKAA